MNALGQKKRKLQPETTTDIQDRQLSRKQQPQATAVDLSSLLPSSSNHGSTNALRRITNSETKLIATPKIQQPQRAIPTEPTNAAAAAAATPNNNINNDENDAQETAISSPKNLFQQLINRSMWGNMQAVCRRRHHASVIRPPLPNWKMATSVELNVGTANSRQAGSQHGHHSMTTRGTIEHLAWDASGMLLASSHLNVISIFDWDGVMASHLQAMTQSSRSNSRHHATGNSNDNHDVVDDNIHPTARMLHSVLPIVQFQVPYAIAALLWNPSDPDLLSVAFRTEPYVHVYDVAKVAEAQSNTPHNTHQRVSSRLPRSCYMVVGTNQNQNSKFPCMHFVDRYHMVLAHERGLLSCWKIPPDSHRVKNQATTTTFAHSVWRHCISHSCTVSSMTNLSCDCLVVGDRQGTMTFVHWKCILRAAFSSEPSPKILASWSTFPSLLSSLSSTASPAVSQLQYKGGWLGIQQIISLDHNVDNAPNSDTSKSDTKRALVLQQQSRPTPQQQPPPRLAGCRVLWVTQGGWVLEASLRGWSDCQSACPVTIHHSPPQNQYQKWDGTAVSTQTTPRSSTHNTHSSYYSTPQDPVRSSMNHNMSVLAWSKVPTITWTLPHHDRLVVTGSVSSLRCHRSEDHGICVGWIYPEAHSQRSTTSSAISSSPWRIHEILWPKTSSPPNVFSLHPSGEWVIAGQGHSMVCFKAFGKR